MTPIFARITKVDEQTRTVTGRAAQEVLDRDNEMFDYASSKPNFETWSAEVFSDSGGKSYGNVRSMHGNIAAGKLTDIEFNDNERAIDVSAQIVDDGEWKKCISGVHTGFSIGGRYAKKWSDVQNGKVIQRYTAVPVEISLVDRPCIPTAKFFTVHKRDGSFVKRKFRSQPMTMSNALHKFIQKNQDTKSIIKGLHATGGNLVTGDFLHKYPVTDMSQNKTLDAIRKSHGASGNQTVDLTALTRMIKQVRRMNKSVSFPPNSRNGQNDNARANDGATLASQGASDEMTSLYTRPAIYGAQSVTDVATSNWLKAYRDAPKSVMGNS